MANHKKSQITIFVVLGIVLLVVFGFLFMYAIKIPENQIKDQTKKAASDILELSAIRYYINLCLEQSLNDAIYYVGTQGGVLYKNQKGSFELSQTLKVKNSTVKYGLVRQGQNSFFPSLPPDYPFIGHLDPFPKTNLPYFGKDMLTSLCDPKGPNAGKSTYLKCSTFSENSTQEQLTRYIYSDLGKRCGDLSFIKILAQGNYTVSVDRLNVSVTITSNSVVADLFYPVTVKFPNVEPSNVLYKFRVEKDVRLRKVHELAKDIIYKDSRSLNYSINTDYLKSQYYYSGLSIEKVPEVCPNCNIHSGRFDDLVVVKDYYSNIKGKPYEFYFLRQNRFPVLDWIGNKTLKDSNVPDIVTRVGENLSFALNGFDPDEEYGLVYNYSNWKQDYNDEFDFDKYSRKECRNPEDCIIKRYGYTGFNWKGTDLFKRTSRDTDPLTLFNKDIGPHNLTISVCDREGLCDYQDLNILVLDLAKTSVSHSNMFSDLTNKTVVSVEDLIFLRPEYSGIFSSMIGEFRWEFLGKKFNSTGEVYLPDPRDITKANTQDEKYTTKTLSLTTLSNYGSPDAEIKLAMFQCLPHVNTTAEIFPWGGKNVGEGYYQNHACCNGLPTDNPFKLNNELQTYKTESGSSVTWGSYKDSSNICHTEQNLFTCSPPEGYKDNFNVLPMDGKLKTAKISNPDGTLRDVKSTDITVTLQPKSGSYALYKRSITQYCSGNRGNVCSGKVLDSWELFKDENFYNPNNFEESCTGFIPESFKGQIYLNNCSGFVFSNPGPFDYNGNTFEGLFSGGTGLCNSTFAKSKPGIGGYNVPDGFMKCQATCDGAGGCTKAVNCVCDTDYGSICEKGNSGYYEQGNICYNGLCNPKTCNYEKSDHYWHCDYPSRECEKIVNGKCLQYYNILCKEVGWYAYVRECN